MLALVREATFGHDLIDWFDDDGFPRLLSRLNPIDLRDGDVSAMKDRSIYLNTLANMVRMHAERRTSHVLITPLNGNWGAFATTIPHRTIDWGNWEEQLGIERCTPEQVRQYLDDPMVRAVVATQQTVFSHRAIMTLPIGVDHSDAIGDYLVKADETKTQELLISNSGWGHRKQINERVAANFDRRIVNWYPMQQSDYYGAIARSKFVLCPSGLGWDSCRVWETLILGSIPIVEYSHGWHTVLDDLPALFVTNFNEVTPALLASAYPLLMGKCAHFNFAKLTKWWWVSKITAAS